MAVASPGEGWWLPVHMPVAQFRADPVTVHRWTELGGTRGDQKLDQSRVEVYQEDNHLKVNIHYVE